MTTALPMPLRPVWMIALSGALLSATVGCRDDHGGDAATTNPVFTSPSQSPMASQTFTENTADPMNPERGFFDAVDLLSTSGFSHVRTKGMTVAMAHPLLKSYINKPIPQSFLDQLAGGLQRVRAARIKIILRFRYDEGETWPSYDPATQESTIDWMISHMNQLGPIVRDYADVIAVMQAGFIGPWGEWHSSDKTAADRRRLLEAQLAWLPKSRMTQVRAPKYMLGIYGSQPVTEEEAFAPLAQKTDKARIGFYDDGLLASATDLGTFSGDTAALKAYTETWTRYTSSSGETAVWDPTYANGERAIQELGRFHWTLLNSLYNTTVINNWKTSGHYPEIRRRLGYRFSLASASWTSSVAPGGELDLVVKIRNTGFARLVNPRPVHAVLTNGSITHVAALDDADPTRWMPGGTAELQARLRVPATLPPGSYRLALWLPDDSPVLRPVSDYAIRFANDGVWEPATGYNRLTDAFTVDAAAGGAVDPAATVFARIP